MSFFRSPSARWLALPVGAVYSLSFAPFGWWPLAILCPAYLFLVWQAAEPRQAAKAGFWFTAGTFLAGTYWLYHTIYVIGRAPIWLTLFAMLGLVAVMAAYAAAVGYGFARWLRRGSAFDRLLVLPAAWVTMEWFRGWFLSGFPWFAAGYSQIDTPLAGLAPVGGIYTVSFAVLCSAGALTALLLGGTRERILAAAVAGALWLVAFGFWDRPWTEATGEPVTVAIVQGAVPQDLKWSIAQRDATIELYRSLTEPHLGTDIIVWPEAALPALVHELGHVLGPQWVDARNSGSALVLGQLREDGEQGNYYNGVLALDREAQWYYKRRLVPLSEYFPVPDFVREWLRGLDLPYSGFEPGARRQPALDAAGQKLGVTICYEDAYAADQLAVLHEATLLVNVTNDAWFGDSTAAHQHLEISRMRALEAGRPLLRAANDGISAIIGADGRVVEVLPRFEPGVLTGSVQPRIGLTPYARVGNWPIVSLCLILLGVALLPRLAALRARRAREAAV